MVNLNLFFGSCLLAFEKKNTNLHISNLLNYQYVMSYFIMNQPFVVPRLLYPTPFKKKKKKVPPPLWNNKAMYSYFIYVLSSPEPSKTYAPQTQTYSHPQTQVFLQISLPVFHVIPENKIYFSAFCAVEHQLPLFCCHQTHTHTLPPTVYLFPPDSEEIKQTWSALWHVCLFTPTQ